jgi:DnaJ-class molecular chaperone
MTDEEVSAALETMRAEAKKRLAALRLDAEGVVNTHHREVDVFLRTQERRRCLRCDGTGGVERMDSGYMRRFGLREWDGCPDCGGDGEKKGKGFLP